MVQRMPSLQTLRTRQRALIREQKGSVIILFALGMAALIGFMAISLDAGSMYAARSKMVNIADAAALAGATFLPEQPGQAYAAAIDTAVMNGVAAGDVVVNITENNTRVDVALKGPAELRFATVSGSKKVSVPATSLGAVEIITGVYGAQPFGVEKENLVYGQKYVIKLGSGSQSAGDAEPYRGNYHALALGRGGASEYRSYVQSGYPGLVSVGQQIDTEPGNMAGPTQAGLQARLDAAPTDTWQNYSLRSPRILLVPVVSGFEVKGRTVVEVIGFAAFFLESYEPAGNGQVVGRFIRYHTEGQLSAYRPELDFGLRSVKLLR